MRVEDMIFISVDDHLVEPPHLFEGRMPAKFADHTPRVEHTDTGDDVWIFDGQTIPNIGLNAVAGRPKEEYGVNPTAFDEMRPGCYDVHERVKDMSAGGVLACMCFPSFPSFSGRLFLGTADKDLALACVQAYNDWHIDEWSGSYPGRFIPMALPVLWDPELSAAEIRRVAAKGCHSVTFTENPNTLGLPSFHDAHWDPMWRALVEEGTILNIHLGSSGQLAVTAPDAPIDVMITLQPMNICAAAADLVWSRVFKEFPALRVALSEGGTGWIPYFLDRLDRTYDMHHLWTGQDFGDRTPADIFREHILTCFIADPIGLKLRDDIGIDNICWEQDYPHSDSSWPRAPEELATVAARYDVTDAELDKITHENAMRWYHFDPFAHRPRVRCTVAALRAEVPGHDVTIRAMDKGRFAGKGAMSLGELADGDGVTLLDDYSGPFDPKLELADFSRRALAPLGREYLLHGHLQDRVGMPLVLSRHTLPEMNDVAIEEWMAASPVYSMRTQRALAFGNADVPTIFKNIQLDIGAPHQFMDFRYKVDDAEHGEFWLDHCGALMDVEPMGEEFVHGMCHDIEDPTFDATAGATNPYAQVRPIHRPPRVPSDRAPHCHWRVVIDETGVPVQPHPSRAVIAESEIARVEIDDPGRDAEPGGWFDYSGAFDPDFTLEDLSHRALVVALQEVAVQTHLLAHAYLFCVASRWGVAEAQANAPQVFTGTAGVAAGRLPPVLGIAGDDAEAIAKLLQFHPVFHPRAYVAPSIDLVDERTVRFALADTPCFHERDHLSWIDAMQAEPDPALDAIAQAVNPRAFSTPDATRGDERLAWRIAIDPDAQPARRSPNVDLARISTGATVTFLPRRDLRT